MSHETMTSSPDFVMPVVDYQDEKVAFDRPHRPQSITGKTIALLPNFRVISPAFMQVLADNLRTKTGIKQAYLKNTPDWPFNHPERLGKIASEIDHAARGCDLMISGVGD